nr:NADH oxidoreductase [uncultured Erwinia sp.]
MNMHPLCQWRMQVHHLHQETPDVWTIALINHDFYRWQAGQYALVSIGGGEEVRAYTLSSTPGQSELITLTVRHIADGKASGWLTQRLKPGDNVWLSDPQGDFSCERYPAANYLFLAAGCGITPVMSMCRWLRQHRPECGVRLVYSVRSANDVIFAGELASMQPWLKLTILAENQPAAGMLPGRLDRMRLASLAPDIADATVMICGPQPYMVLMENDAAVLGARQILTERFTPGAAIPPDEPSPEAKATLTLSSPLLSRAASFPAGWSLLAAMEAHHLPVTAVCRAGVCGCCKTRVASGNYTTSSTLTLTEEEIAQGYVLACSCQPQGDIVLC